MIATTILIAAAVIATALITVVVMRSRSGTGRAQPTRLLAEHVVDMVSTHHADGTFRYVSPVLAGLFGEYPGALVGKNPGAYAHPNDAQALSAMWRRSIAWSGSATTVTWRCKRHDGSYSWLETTARATAKDVADQLGAIVCASRDVTERKQIEDALRDSENRFRSAIETVRLVAIGLDVQGRVTFANEALLTLTGWSRSELIGENWFDRATAPDDPARDVFYSNINEGRIPAKLEHEIICSDGRRRMIEWDNTVLRTPGGVVQGTASLGADVTERRQEETALKLVQSITVAISEAKDLDTAFTLTLEALCRATGWGFGDALIPMRDEEGDRLRRATCYAAPGVNAKALIEVGASFSIAQNEGFSGRVWKSKQVEWIPDLAAVPREHSEGLYLAAQCGFRAGVGVPVLSRAEVVAVLVFFMDRLRGADERNTQMITLVANQVGGIIERRRTQIQYEAQLLRARDDAQAASHAKSDFLSRMSHELRTPLNSVIGFANVLRKNKGGRLADEDLVFLDRIEANGQHLLTLVNNVLDIAKVEAGRMTVTTGIVAVDALLRGVVEQLEGQPRPDGVALRADVPEDMDPIESDGVLLRQVLINLAGNALRFTQHGSVVLSAETDGHGRPARIYVRDTGIGIPANRLDAIFEPFEQATQDTHRTYGGTGLGLSISKAICDELGYDLTVSSKVGHGSTFTIELLKGAQA